MAGENTVASMDGLFKEVYGDQLNNVVPNSSICTKLFKFEGNTNGDSYHQPVTLTNEHGFTYNGTAGAVATLNAPVQATLKDSTATGYEMVGRSRLAYVAASRAAGAGKQAFAKAWGTILLNLRKASMKRLELTMLRGQMGLGQVSGTPAANVITISDATWSPTTWAGMEGAILEGWTTQAATSTQRTGGSIDLTITAVSFANKTITVTVDGDLADGDYLYLKGAKTSTGFNEAAGLIKIAQNTGSIFGIDAASYALWGGNTKSSFGVPTMARYLDAASQAVEKGLEETLNLMIPPKAWEVLNSDLSAQRIYDGSYSKERAENGSQKICYYGQAGAMEVQSHVYLQRGESVMCPGSAYKRVGSADVGMGVPGTDGRDVFFHLPDANAVEARTFSDQALFTDGPSTSCYISGITYSS